MMYTEFSRKLGIAVVAICIIGLCAGCGDDEVSAPPEEFAPPTNLSYVNGDSEITLDWDHSPDRNRSDFAGYNVYRSTSTMVGLERSELDALLLNQTPIGGGVSNYSDGDVAADTKYYYQVRSVKENDELSRPAATASGLTEIVTATRIEGANIVSLFEFADTRPSGLDLSDGAVYSVSSSDPDNRTFIDVYLGTSSEMDEADAGQALVLKSPNLVLNGSPDWVGRVTALKLLDSFDAPTTSNQGWSNQITLGSTPAEVTGKVIAIKTPDNHYGKVQIIGASGDDGQRKIELRWAYQTLQGEIIFGGGL